MEDTTIIEGFLIDKTAEEYRRKGYKVSQGTELDFLPGFCPDLVARKDDESIAIDVKARSTLAANPKLREVVETIRSEPGWSFNLVLVAEPDKLEAPDDAQPIAGEGIIQQIEKAEAALEAGLPEAAFLLAWSACEAAVREMNAAEGISTRGVPTAGYVIGWAVSQGVISRLQYNKLMGMMRYRNAIAHGFSLNTFSDKLVKDLIKNARRMAKTASSKTRRARGRRRDV